MNLARFQADRNEAWSELGRLVTAAKGRPQRLDPDELLRAGALYRSVVADLARVRHHFPGDPVTRRLETLAVQGRQLIYESEFRRFRIARFLATGYWQLIASRPVPLLVAALLLMGPAALAWTWAIASPEEAVSLVPAQFQGALQPGPEGTDQMMSGAEQTAFSAFLITNNSIVAMLSFAAGIAFCVGAVYVLVNNGVVLGAVGGLLVGGGNGRFFVELVAAHGVLELSAIVVSAAAGLRMGWALVDPGPRTRRAAVVEEARASVLILLGTLPWIGVAGIIEAFVSRSGFEATPMVVVGLVVGGLYWFLMWSRGRVEVVDQTLARALAAR